jgi:hypothetical protein
MRLAALALTSMPSDELVFISYAREDQSWAERLYMDLRKLGINAWLDTRCLGPGSNWEFEIKQAIRKCRHFILLLSKHSVNKRGFVQKEMKQAIRLLEEFPTGSVFLIPVRLDRTEPIDDELRELNWVDLNPNYHDGFARILSSLSAGVKSPLIVVGRSDAPTMPATVIDKGREVEIDMPMILGSRASISYAPFRSRKEFLQQFIDRLPSESIFQDKSFSYYFTLDTRHESVLLGDDLKTKYPEYITLVLQNAFRGLQVRDEGFSVILKFNGIGRTIAVPFEAIRRIAIPEIGISISLDPPEPGVQVPKQPTPS